MKEPPRLSAPAALLARLVITLLLLVVGLGLALLALLWWAYSTMGGPHSWLQNAGLALALLVILVGAGWLLVLTWRRGS